MQPLHAIRPSTFHVQPCRESSGGEFGPSGFIFVEKQDKMQWKWEAAVAGRVSAHASEGLMHSTTVVRYSALFQLFSY